MSPKALYVHIPFCNSICAYCDFPKVIYRPDWSKAYLGALFDELQNRAREASFETIYVGGGTPSALSSEELSRLLEQLAPKLEEGGEFTVEANPESLAPEKVALLSAHKVNRVSLGVESSSPRLLSLMGRKHDFEKVKETIALLRAAGISNINADLIYALPGETMEELEEDLERFLELGIPHISAYTLILEDCTLFKKQGFSETDQDTQAAMYELVLAKLRKAGYQRYEVSNFALPGHQSRHNLVYWHDEEYIGVGLGAAGYYDGIRYTNTRSLTKYLKGGDPTNEKEIITRESDLSYFLLCNLRLERGFAKEDFLRKFGKPFDEVFPSAGGLVRRGWLNSDEKRVACTDQGLLVLDRVLLELA